MGRRDDGRRRIDVAQPLLLPAPPALLLFLFPQALKSGAADEHHCLSSAGGKLEPPDIISEHAKRTADARCKAAEALMKREECGSRADGSASGTPVSTTRCMRRRARAARGIVQAECQCMLLLTVTRALSRLMLWQQMWSRGGTFGSRWRPRLADAFKAWMQP